PAAAEPAPAAPGCGAGGPPAFPPVRPLPARPGGSAPPSPPGRPPARPGGSPLPRAPGSPPGPPRPGIPAPPGPPAARPGPAPAPASGPPRRSPGTPAPLLLLRRPLLALRGLGGGPAHARNRWHPGDAATAEHLPHHLLAFLEPDDQVVHLTDGGAGALRDAC